MEATIENTVIGSIIQGYENVAKKVTLLKPNEADNDQIRTRKDLLRGVFKPIILFLIENNGIGEIPETGLTLNDLLKKAEQQKLNERNPKQKELGQQDSPVTVAVINPDSLQELIATPNWLEDKLPRAIAINQNHPLNLLSKEAQTRLSPNAKTALTMLSIT